jgi:hypothetical protein
VVTPLDADTGVITRRLIFTLTMPLVIGGFILLTVLFFRPLFGHLSSALIGPPEDNMQDFWNSWHVATAHDWRDLLFTTQIRYPEGTSLSYHSFAWPQVAAVALLGCVFGTSLAKLILLHNLTLLASFPLSAVAMFLLARHLLGEVAGRDTGAALAGFIFAFNPWHVTQVMHHAHVATIEFLPLLVLLYLRSLEEHDYRFLVAAIGMMALSALSCWYYLFYALYFMIFELLYLCIRDRKWPRGWILAAPALCLGGSLLLLAPWLIPMIGTDAPTYPGANEYVADLLALIAFPPTHVLAQAGSGLANLAALAWAMTRKTDKRLLHYALSGMLFFTVIAAGETLHVGGHVTWLALPDFVLAKLPFFANVRTPARAMVMVYMFLGLGLAQACVIALRHRTATARAGLALAAVLILLDFTPANLAATPVRCPPALDVIADDPDGFGVLDLPRGYIEGNAAMTLSACHGHAIVVGETSRKLGVTLADRLVTDDLAVQQRQLAAAHVKYIVLHRPQGGLFLWNKRDGRFTDYVRTYRHASADDDMVVLRVY